MKRIIFHFLILLSSAGFCQAQYFNLKPKQSAETKLWGFVDKKTGDTIIDFQFQKVGYFSNKGLVNAKKGGKWGMIDTNGKTVINFKYDKKFYFYNGIGQVEKNGKSGVIDSTGKTLLDIKYNYVNMGGTEGFAIASDGKKKYALYSLETGKMLDNAQVFDDLYWSSYIAKQLVSTKNKKQGVVDIQGKIILPNEYEEVYPCQAIDAYVTFKKGRFGLVSSLDGSVIIPNNYSLDTEMSTSIGSDGPYAFFGKNEWFILENGSKWGIIDSKGKQIVSFEYDAIKIFRCKSWDSPIVKLTKGAKSEFVNKDIEPIITDKEIQSVYGNYNQYSDYFILQLEDGIVFYDGKNETIVREIDFNRFTSKYDKVKYNIVENEEGKFGLISYKGKQVLPFEYSRIRFSTYGDNLYNAKFKVEKGKLNGIYEVGKGFTTPLK